MLTFFIYMYINYILKLMINLSPSYNNEVHHHSTRQTGRIHMGQTSLEIRRKALRHQCVLLLNSEPNVDYNVPVTTFKFCLT